MPEQAGLPRLDLDRRRCEAYGFCEQAAPDLVHLDDDDELVIDVETILPELEPRAAAAARACPVAALRLATRSAP